jgi:hypothetical protein
MQIGSEAMAKVKKNMNENVQYSNQDVKICQPSQLALLV